MAPDSPPPAWTDDDLSDPHAHPEKARRVQEMFAAIAEHYDLNNRVHSLWRDQAWRRAAVRLCHVQPDDVVLDVACGTGDLTLAFRRAGARHTFGADFTYPMLQIADRKHHALTDRIQNTTRFLAADAMRLPVADNSIDIVSIAFGIRNVTDPAAAIREFHRVLRPRGRVMILEFSLPRSRTLRSLYGLYFNHVLPRTATWISRDRTGAYKYLPRSVNTFLDRKIMIQMLQDAGFTNATCKPLTFGVAAAYHAIR
ncbi:MAG: bifunctional demethylmenaquinone methyltransferase/2-methoxy-6-polyprenyl-1,4-benzoquinol methylase UbiE [Planctomycetaceae bacterium]|nr:bifunctional demethylmenaquinone methyltransferase/2-methoxy-6-polyprenyl-1,4-benzoquinol methylase UbiE [Planctomycetaceae bacterium]